MATAADLDQFDFIEPDGYVANGYPHDVWTRMRAEAPVYWFDRSEGHDFWAITKHEDIVWISKRPELFISDPTLVVQTTPEAEGSDLIPKNLIQFDPPKHGIQRKLISKGFTPRALRRFHADIERIAKGVVDDLFAEGDEGEADFVERIAAPLPIAVIGWLLGVPEPDWPKLFHWTNRILGATDAEYADEGKNPVETVLAAQTELFAYFSDLVAKRKADPKDDLVTLFAFAEVEGQKLSDIDILVWCMLIVAAGNETTRNATSGGMMALIEHQDQLRKLQADDGLLTSGVEEILRWTSPIIHFARTATEDIVIKDREIKEGQTVALFYPSANRDEDIFEDPFSFRVDRSPNRHLAFGIGEHFCAGAHVARLEIEYALRFLLPRIEEIELAGPPDRLNSNLVGGFKRLPIRYKLRASA
ncbi:MAG: cytochrome P450 [Deltaproteobacteria bacterium]|nr:cytochrome P450 [Deltaproteobacteria bacterium]